MTVLKALVPLALCVALSSFDATGAQSSVNVTPVGSSLQLPATLIRPDGDGPFAAVVVMHD